MRKKLALLLEGCLHWQNRGSNVVWFHVCHTRHRLSPNLAKDIKSQHRVHTHRKSHTSTKQQLSKHLSHDPRFLSADAVSQGNGAAITPRKIYVVIYTTLCRSEKWRSTLLASSFILTTQKHTIFTCISAVAGTSST